MKIEVFYDSATFTLTYLVYSQKAKTGVIIDPVLNFDLASAKTTTQSADKILDFIKKNDLTIKYILETHAHADHLSSGEYLKSKLAGAKTAIGEGIKLVQETFKPVFDMDYLNCDGAEFDLLLTDGDQLEFDDIKIKVINTPGHTPACTSFLFNETALFTGDTIFMEDYGTGRCDFPAGSAKDLYHSITQKIYTLSDNVKIYPGHDYQPAGRELKWESSVAIQKRENIQLKEKTTEAEFVNFREERDKTLNQPKLIMPSVQYNIVAGKLQPEKNGKKYLKYPFD